jgi:hypothetical protein
VYESEDGKITEILEGTALLYTIQEFMGSKKSPEPAILTDVHRGFSQSFQENVTLPIINSKPISSMSFPIYYSPTTLQSETAAELLEESLNRK